jgi:ATP-dependent RNA helicase DeaD
LNNFSKLGLSKSVVDVIEKIGFENPTPIQEKSIPLLIENNPTDFIGLAQTGTGKTAAFGLPLMDIIDSDNKTTQALIMAPTRELSQQTAKQLVDFSANNRSLNIEVVYGGAAISNQIKALKKPTQIVVATPGRLLDLIKRKAIVLKNVKHVILDEADEMLNMGFKEDIDTILSHTLEDRALWLFSATMPREIRRIIKTYMDSPLEVSVNTEQISNVDISHKYVTTKSANRIPALRRFLDIQPEMRGIMFCRTRRETQQIADDLGGMGYGVEALHGDLSQAQRDSVMRRFKSRSMQLLIATDVAARGIDVNDLTHVIHHTLPDQLEYYTHRSGRTGRAGKKGVSLAFINPREGRKITEIEKKIKVKFERIEIPSVELLKSSRINNWANLIINTEVDKQADEILTELQDQFAPLSKEDILKRLITSQLDHLMIQSGEAADLNETIGGSHEKRGNSGFNRYFVNIGMIDGITRGDLLHFLSDISEIDRKSFGEVSIQKNCAFFEVDSKVDQGLGDKFTGIEVEGRSIRVNREDEGPDKSRGSKRRGSSSYKKKDQGNYRGDRSRRDSRNQRGRRH